LKEKEYAGEKENGGSHLPHYWSLKKDVGKKVKREREEATKRRCEKGVTSTLAMNQKAK